MTRENRKRAPRSGEGGVEGLLASLSFVGLGVPPPAPSWGGMLNEARRFLQTAPWMAVLSGIPIVLAILGFSLSSIQSSEIDPGTEAPWSAGGAGCTRKT